MSKITLSKPIEAHGETIAELNLREPTGGDIRDCGLPMRVTQEVGGGVSSDINTASVARYISALARIPASSVANLSAADFIAAMNGVLDFFGSSMPATRSTLAGNSSASSALP